MAGHSIYGPDSIGTLSKFSSTEIRLAASSITIGGLQYDTASLSCLTNVSGVGGLDTGSIAANQTYYVYAVLDSGTVALVCSLNASAPSGFTESKLVGGFFTDGSSQVDYIGEIVGGSLKRTKTKVIQFKQTAISGNEVTGVQNSLIIGRLYKCSGTLYMDGTSVVAPQSKGVSFRQNGVIIPEQTTKTIVMGNDADRRGGIGFSFIFMSTSNDFDANITSHQNSVAELQYNLEELPEHEIVTVF